jgi:hypothetical protein
MLSCITVRVQTPGTASWLVGVQRTRNPSRFGTLRGTAEHPRRARRQRGDQSGRGRSLHTGAAYRVEIGRWSRRCCWPGCVTVRFSAYALRMCVPVSTNSSSPTAKGGHQRLIPVSKRFFVTLAPGTRSPLCWPFTSRKPRQHRAELRYAEHDHARPPGGVPRSNVRGAGPTGRRGPLAGWGAAPPGHEAPNCGSRPLWPGLLPEPAVGIEPTTFSNGQARGITRMPSADLVVTRPIVNPATDHVDGCPQHACCLLDRRSCFQSPAKSCHLESQGDGLGGTYEPTPQQRLGGPAHISHQT